MSDTTYIIVYEVYQAPCRFLNILYIHCTGATRGGGGWKHTRLKTNDLITYTDTEHSRNALLFHFRPFVFWRVYIGRSTIYSVSVIYLSGIWIPPVTGSAPNCLRNMKSNVHLLATYFVCLFGNFSMYLLTAVYQEKRWLWSSCIQSGRTGKCGSLVLRVRPNSDTTQSVFSQLAISLSLSLSLSLSHTHKTQAVGPNRLLAAAILWMTGAFSELKI
jgi:hypothetical protein